MNDSGENLFAGLIGGLIVVVIAVAGFPGGTIAMAVMRHSSELHTSDWIASIIIPFYGILKAFAIIG